MSSPQPSAALPVLNVSSYRFVPLRDLPALRERLFDAATRLRLLGTVLLAEEGINLFLAGRPDDVRQWLAELHADDRFAGLQPKESWSAAPPFQRLKVKIKSEIIRMNAPQGAVGEAAAPGARGPLGDAHPAATSTAAVSPEPRQPVPPVNPARGRAPSVAPRTLARWLAAGHDDEGREVVMLDTRNDFEVDRGAFDGAIDWRLPRFSDFPAKLLAHRDELAGKTVVSYCTGGIRCEKAALVMRAMGLEHTLQLEGGILKYFEETDGAPFWHGECFVFDDRRAVDAGLAPAA